MLPIPWSQRVHLSWAPALSFYENRFHFLRDLEERALLKAFRVDERENVEAKLGDFNHEASLGPTGVSLEVTGNNADWERCAVALGLALKHVDPPTIRRVEMRFKHVLEVPLPYDDARAAAARVWYGPWQDRLRITDHALLIDGELGDVRIEFQIEFGVIEKDELLSRIAGAGRVSAPTPLRTQLSVEQAPEVAIFADSRWGPFGSLPSVEKTEGWVNEHRNTVLDGMVDLFNSLSKGTLEADVQE